MEHEEVIDEYWRQLRTLPPLVAAKIEVLQDRVNAQDDLIAWLLLELQRLPNFPDGHFQASLLRWAELLGDQSRYVEHAPLAEYIVELIDALPALQKLPAGS